MLSFLIPLVLVGIVAAVIAYFQRQRTQARGRAVAALAAKVGFTFDPQGDDVIGMPFKFFEVGNGQHAEFVISGQHNGMPLKIFDFAYSTGSGRSRQIHRFTCAVLTIAAGCPELGLSHESALSRLGEHLGQHDVQLEYDDFNRHFRVNCDQQKFAFALLDGQMMQWLLSADSFDHIEVVGPWVLMVSPPLVPEYWLNLGNWLDAFRTRIPAVVYSTYPLR